MKRIVNVAVVALVATVVAGGIVSVLQADIATPRPRWTKVRMVSEDVQIKLSAKRVRVEATFHMYSEGNKGEQVVMGYPLGTFEKKLHDFTVSVDGVAIKKVRTQTNPAASSGRKYGRPGAPRRRGSQGGAGAEAYRFAGPYKQWKVFNVSMDGDGPKVVKVSYWVEPAKIVDAKGRNLLHYTYTLRTGATWKGTIGEAAITVALDGVKPAGIVRRTPVGCKVSKDGKALSWTLRDFKPTDNIEITYVPEDVS